MDGTESESGIEKHKTGAWGLTIPEGTVKKTSGQMDQNTVMMHQSKSSCQLWMDGIMEIVRDKSFWGVVVFVALFVTSIVVLLADNAMAR
jgi:hypothetical protein